MARKDPNRAQEAALIENIRKILTTDLLKEPWKSQAEQLSKMEPKKDGPNWRTLGHCYGAAEALFHLLGGKEAGWVSQCMRHEDSTHWFLLHREGHIADPTWDQFNELPDYSKARGTGFLTRAPSKRAQTIIERVSSGITPSPRRKP